MGQIKNIKLHIVTDIKSRTTNHNKINMNQLSRSLFSKTLPVTSSRIMTSHQVRRYSSEVEATGEGGGALDTSAREMSLGEYLTTLETVQKFINWHSGVSGYRKLGLKFDDFNFGGKAHVAAAIDRLPDAEANGRKFRILQDDVPYLQPYLTQVKAEK